MVNTSVTISAIRYLQIIFFASAILYFGSELLIPILYGVFIAIVLYPFCKKLEQHGWPRSLAITAGLIVVSAVFLIICYLFIYQLNLLGKDLPSIYPKITQAIDGLQVWLFNNTGISINTQRNWWEKMQEGFTANISSITQVTLRALAHGVAGLLLVPVYAVLFLYERSSFVYFLTTVAGKSFGKRLPFILNEVIHTYSNFVSGMVMVYFIVGCLNTAGLLALGIPHALLFGMLTAVMTIIPYVGIIVSALIPISIAWLTKDSLWYPFGVVMVFAVVQYLEANVIFPRVVGSRLNLSTWATLVAIIAGGLLWGVSGMILFIPILGIFRILLEYIPEWRSIGLLLEREEAVVIQKTQKNISR